MSNRKIWLITGASRGMGVDFAKAALAAGHAVVASGRDSDEARFWEFAGTISETVSAANDHTGDILLYIR